MYALYTCAYHWLTSLVVVCYCNHCFYKINDVTIGRLILYVNITEIGEFQTVVGGFITIVDRLAKQVEQEKMKVNK